MKSTVNKITIVGVVGRDPTMSMTKAGTKVAEFTVGTDRHESFLGPAAATDWHPCKAWNRQAQFCEDSVRAGDRIYIEGRMEYGAYENDDGVVIPTAETLVREVVLMGGPA